jgi:hypothetical protein
MAQELDDELRHLVAVCTDGDWSDPQFVCERLGELLQRPDSTRRLVRRRWSRLYEELSWLDRVTLIDAHINRRGLPETWLLRAGIIEACHERGYPLPGWPMPRWPLDATRLDGVGGTVLHRAMDSEAWVAEQLLTWGAKPDMVDARGQTPLHLAAADRVSDLVRLLLRHRACSALRDHLGRTPLQVALLHGNFFSALMLVKAGAPAQDVGEHNEALRLFARGLGEQEVEARLTAARLDATLAPETPSAAPSRRRI